MPIEFGEKLTLIKEREGLNRPQFAEKVGVKVETMRKADSGSNIPKADFIARVCLAFPQYTLWLMTDKTNPALGQISPENKPPKGLFSNYGALGILGVAGVAGAAVNPGDAIADYKKRDTSLAGFVKDWMATRSPEDCVWLEKQIERAVPEFKAWKERKDD